MGKYIVSRGGGGKIRNALFYGNQEGNEPLLECDDVVTHEHFVIRKGIIIR